MRKLSRQERFYLIAIAAVLALLCVKSILLDPYDPVLPEETAAQQAYFAQADELPFFLRERIVSINLDTETAAAQLRIRRYLFGIIPYWDKTVAVQP